MLQKQAVLWAYPLVMLVVQILPPTALAVAGAGLLTGAVLLPRYRVSLALFGSTAVGHFLWIAFGALLHGLGVTGTAAVILGRFGLLGYLACFLLWERVAPRGICYLRLGTVKAEIRFPFIWRGKKEPVWRFVLIFCAICGAVIVLLAVRGNITGKAFLLGLLFTVVNATLEELLWRGLILPRIVVCMGEKQALLITALAFGLYHISLGFPLWACFVFAIGGFYMGGSTIVSKGLLASWVMHSMVNMIFVCAGILF